MIRKLVMVGAFVGVLAQVAPVSAQTPKQPSHGESLYDAPSERAEAVGKMVARHLNALRLHLGRIEVTVDDLRSTGLGVKRMKEQIGRTEQRTAKKVGELKTTAAELDKQHVRFDETIKKLLGERKKQVGGVVDAINRIKTDLDNAERDLRETQDIELPGLDSDLSAANSSSP